MFDRTTIHAGPSRVTIDANITEKKAPTDDSIRLLQEMEEKTLGRIVDKMLITTPDNAINGIAFMLNHADFFYRVTLAFTLNGRKFQVKLKERESSNLHEYVDECVKVMAEQIARSVLVDSGVLTRRF